MALVKTTTKGKEKEPASPPIKVNAEHQIYLNKVYLANEDIEIFEEALERAKKRKSIEIQAFVDKFGKGRFQLNDGTLLEPRQRGETWFFVTRS